MSKQRPFTRRQRASMRKQERRERAAEAREMRWEQKAWEQEVLPVFKGCDPARTEALADGER